MKLMVTAKLGWSIPAIPLQRQLHVKNNNKKQIIFTLASAVCLVVLRREGGVLHCEVAVFYCSWGLGKRVLVENTVTRKTIIIYLIQCLNNNYTSS